MKTESIKLSDARKTALTQIAANCSALNARGTKRDRPSWRALVYAIADGKVECRKK